MRLRLILLAILVASFIAPLVPAGPAGDVRGADSGACRAYIRNVDVSSYNTPDHAFPVDYLETVTVRVVSPLPFISHKVDMAFMDLFSWTVSEETDTGTETSYETPVDVADYADYGIGLYKVTARGVLQDGRTCSAVVFIVVGGTTPVSTVAGIVALVLAVGGALGLLILLILIFMGILGSSSLVGCLGVLPFAALLIPLAMVTGGGQSSGSGQTTGSGGAPQAPAGSPDASGGGVKFRLKISLLAIGCALLSTIGFVVLFQQMGSVYPTITVVVLSLVLGLVAGILLPTLAATFARRRK